MTLAEGLTCSLSQGAVTARPWRMSPVSDPSLLVLTTQGVGATYRAPPLGCSP